VNLVAMLTRLSNIELTNLPDCEGLLENGKCKWLTVPKCIGAKCSYCQEAGTLDKTYARLRSLDEVIQDRIAKKYYGGSRPWEKPEKPWRQ